MKIPTTEEIQEMIIAEQASEIVNLREHNEFLENILEFLKTRVPGNSFKTYVVVGDKGKVFAEVNEESYANEFSKGFF